MTFAVYLPPQAKTQKVPVLWYLSGLTCTHENAMTKAAAQGWAAEQGIALIFPDTSPRGDDVANDDAYDLGKGAGFYVNATQDPWAPHFQMWDYVTSELPDLVFENFPLLEDAQGITGHSMGGHGALTIGMTLPQQYKSLSAFAPIANPTQSDWGRKQFTAYLGKDTSTWNAHDATQLMAANGFPTPVLIDQGTSDNFLELLMPDALKSAMAARRQAGEYRMQEGYDHSYYFMMSFMKDHIEHHAKILKG
jgi:S-formylglutathione hydrolase